jgi:molybdate transport system ATP-binding protein
MAGAVSLQLDIRLPRKDFELKVQLELASSGITAVYGPSGCGKTTLLRCIAGLERPPWGRLQFNDQVWQQERHFVPPHRRRLGYVFQESSLFPHLRVHENLRYAFNRVPAGERRVLFDDAVAFLGLKELLDRAPHELSGGQRQRVAIARALLASPQLLLMDEPLSNLDHAGRQEVLPYLERLHEDLLVPIIYVSHEISEVMLIADHLVLLAAGQLTASGPLEAMLTRADLPLAHLEQAGSVLLGTVIGHDPRYHLSYLAVSGGQLAISQRQATIGQSIRVRIEARDVSLALQPPHQSSITNVLPARVIDISDDPDPAQRLVRLDLDGKPLLARITRRSEEQLGIVPGTRLYAQIKSVALMH